MAEEEDEDKVDGAADANKNKKKQKKKKKKDKEQEDAVDAPEAADAGEVGVQPEAVPVEYAARPNPFEPQDHEWTDISELCNLAVQGMSLGDMVSSDKFRLLDAMSAIEIMDPKMDTGFNSSADMSVERGIKEGLVKDSLSHGELITIFDELLMYYLMWLDGHTIVQTCWCCLYLQNIQEYVKPVPALAVFVDAFLLACRSANNAVHDARIFDDEDFMPTLFGIDLDQYALSAKGDEVQKNLQAERKKLATEKSDAAKAVSSRLEFIGEYAWIVAELSETKQGKKRNFDSALRRLKLCGSLLEQLAKGDALADAAALRCFDASLNRKKLVPGPPRIVDAIRDRTRVLGMWTTHLQDLQLCCNTLQVPLGSLLSGIFTRAGDPNILVRSVVLFVASEPGHLLRLIEASLEEYLFPKDAREHCTKDVEDFLAHCESLLMHLLKLASANRARRFRRLAHVFSDFHSLQHEAWALDEKLQKTYGCNLRHPRPCWVWTMEFCLNAMILKLLLGFDLDLYDAAEFHMIYWYVDYLYGLRIFNLSELYVNKEQPIGGAKKKPSRQSLQDKKAAVKPKNAPVALQLLEATQATVRGLFRLLAFCICRGLLSVPPAAAEKLEQRFVLRFRSLEAFRLPHLPSYRDFAQSSKSAEGTIVLEAAASSLAEAKQFLEKLSKDPAVDSSMQEVVKGLQRVVVANQLVVMMLTRSVNELDKLKSKVVAKNAHHPHFVSLSISKD